MREKKSITYNPASPAGRLQPTTYQKGQTLIEVVIAVGLIVMVLTTLVAGLTLGIRNNRVAKDQAVAKDYTRAAQEWLRSMRDQGGWETFASVLRSHATGSTVRYCLRTLPDSLASFNSLTAGTCGAGQTVDGRFTRQAVITLTGGANPTKAEAVVTVTWVDGTKTLTSTSTLTLYKWN